MCAVSSPGGRGGTAGACKPGLDRGWPQKKRNRGGSSQRVAKRGGTFLRVTGCWLTELPARLTRAGWTALAGSGTFWPGLFHFEEWTFRFSSRVMSGRDRSGYVRAAMPVCSASDCAAGDQSFRLTLGVCVHSQRTHISPTRNFEPR